MPQSLDEALAYADRWVDLIHQPTVPDDIGKQIIEESKYNFAEYFNRGWLAYRKSVTEAGDWAATEWSGQGAVFRDVLGREYIDCLGGYGLLAHGWSNPEIVDTVRAQLTYRTPMPSQELIDPLRGVLARLMAQITPGDIQYSFFCGSGTEGIEGAIKLAKLYTRKSGFIVAVKAFHGKTMGSLSMMGKADYRKPAVRRAGLSRALWRCAGCGAPAGDLQAGGDRYCGRVDGADPGGSGRDCPAG
jgi:putrescine aminotransferase